MKDMILPHNHGENAEKLTSKMPQINDFGLVSDLFRQLSDCSRIRIFWLLCHCEECVINISAMVEMTSPAVSHHLKQLKTSGLIVSERNGKEVYYKSANTVQANALHLMIEELLELTCPDEVNNENR